MNKLILIVMLFAALVFSQQINYTFGYDATSGAELTGVFDIDSTGATTYSVVFKLNDYYWWDANPIVTTEVLTLSGDGPDTVGMDTLSGSTTTTNYLNTNRSVFGTLYSYFVADDATDSVCVVITVYAGVKGTVNESIAGIKWHPTAVTLETITNKGDYCSVQNVYVGSTYYKHFPPEYLKVIYSPASSGNLSGDGVNLYYRYAYPAIYHQEAIQKPE